MSGTQLRIVALLVLMVVMGALVAWVNFGSSDGGGFLIKSGQIPVLIFKPAEDLAQVKDTGQVLRHIAVIRLLRNPEYQDQLLAVLRDSSRPEVQAAAIGALTALPGLIKDPNAILVFIKDPKADARVRQEAIMYAAEKGITAAQFDILDCLEDSNRNIRATASAALEQLTRMHFNFDPDAPPAVHDQKVKDIRAYLNRQHD